MTEERKPVEVEVTVPQEPAPEPGEDTDDNTDNEEKDE